MAYEVHGTCYGSKSEALSATASYVQGGAVSNAGQAYIVTAVPSVSGLDYTFTPIAGGSPLLASVAVDPSPCGLLDWQDGIQLGWLVAGVWLAVLGLRIAARFVWAEAIGDARDA